MEHTDKEDIQETSPVEKEAQYGLSDSDIEDISETLHSEYEDALVAKISALSPADGAELLAKINDEDREKLLTEHSAAFDPYTFSELPSELQKEIIEAMPSEQVSDLISALDSDDALDIIINLASEFQQDIIKKLSARMRLTVQEGLSFPEDSAGRLMQREFVAVPHFWTVGKAIDYLRAAAAELPEDFFDIIVITPTHKVAGEIPLNKLARAQRKEKLEKIMLEETHTIPADMDQEEVAQLFRRENLTSAPVVDDENRLIGVITIDDVVDVIDEESEEDFMKMAGVEQGDLYRAVLSTTGSRFRWLFLNLLTAIAASVVISWFDATIEQVVALAVLMPIVASMGGNAGTQALTVAIRALATREVSKTNAMRIIWKETIVGLLNGIAFAIIMGIIAALWFGIPMLGFVIAAAMAINLFVAGACGAGIPILLERTGSDPAVSSTVFLTTITDVIGFLAFLGLAAAFLI